MVVEKFYGLGGAQAQALRLCRALGRQHVEAGIVTGRWRRSEPKEAEVEGIHVRALFTAFKMFHLKGVRKFGDLVYLTSLLRHLSRTRDSYDILHVHSATVSAVAVATAGQRHGKPTVMKVMASGRWGDLQRLSREVKLLPRGWVERKLRSVDRVVCLNRQAEEECRAAGFSEGQLFCVPNGFPTGDVQPRVEYPVREPLEIAFVGRLDAQKSPVTLLEALPRVSRGGGAHSPQVRFLGDGPLRSALEQRATALGLGGQVRFEGRVPDVSPHLVETDIFVLPSLSEGMSNALLEAMAHGLPCVATRIPGNTDLIRDGETGLLVEPSDPAALARAICRLVESPALRETLGRAARAHVESHLDMDVVAGRYASLYRELAGV